jgi:hypothetical protein
VGGATASLVSGVKVLRVFSLDNRVWSIFQKAQALHELTQNLQALLANANLQESQLDELARAFAEAVNEDDFAEIIRRDALLRMQRASVVSDPLQDFATGIMSGRVVLMFSRPLILSEASRTGEFAKSWIDSLRGIRSFLKTPSPTEAYTTGWRVVPSSLSAKTAADLYQRSSIAFARSLAAARSATAAIAVRRLISDRPPASPAPGVVSDVVARWEDPFTGEPLRAVTNDKAIAIYSVGEDLRDDMGDVGSHLFNRSRDVGVRLVIRTP